MDMYSRELIYKNFKQYNGRKISDYLIEEGFSQKDLTKIRSNEKSIMLNNEYVHMNHVLSENDVLKVFLFETVKTEKLNPVNIDFKIVFEDEDILVIDKPYGLPIHPSKMHSDFSLGNAVAFYYKDLKFPFVFRCVNRLDKDTSGLTIVAKNMLSASVLNNEVKARKVNREYRAIVEDNGILDYGTIDLPIGRRSEKGIERVIDFENGEKAITNYKVIRRFEEGGKKLAYVSYHLETGRTHQIRVHMKTIGCPLIGDKIYNPKDSLMQRQALHAISITLKHPVTGASLFFETDLPQDMKAILKDES